MTTIIPINSLIFLLIGMLLFTLSAFVFTHLFHYRTGKYFTIYTILVGLSISLAPCVFISPVLSSVGTVFALGNSFFLYKTIGLLMQVPERKLYRVFELILLLIVLGGIGAELGQLFGIESALLNPSHILMFYIPLLLFSGVSAAIVLILFKRKFISTENRVSIVEHLCVTVFLFLSNALLFMYANLSVWMLVYFNIIL